MDFKKMGAEFVGTAILVIGGVGAAVFAGQLIGVFGIAVAFGLTLLALVYAIGPVSGAHVNPAVTLGNVLSGRMRPVDAVQYWVAQFLGGILGAALVVIVRVQVPGLDQKEFGANGWGSLSQTNAHIGGAFIVEILATFLFVFVVLAVTSRAAATGTPATPAQGIAIGVAFAVAYLISMPVSGGGVNPARSLGPAIFAGGQALAQVWLYIVAPLLGSVLAVLVHAPVAAESRVVASERQPEAAARKHS
ncbi:MAG: MIP/aquaporin family protein [Streptosporangiales bacterium]